MRTLTFIVSVLFCSAAAAQSAQLTVAQAIEIASKNNLGIRTASLDVESQRQMKKTGFDLPKTNVSLLYGQYNGYPKNDNNFTITQSIPFTTLGSQASLNRSLYASSQLKKVVTENELTYNVKQTYYSLAFQKARRALLLEQDTIFQGFLKSSTLRHRTGESNLLEKTTAETQRNEVLNQLRMNESTITMLRMQLKALLNTADLPDIADNALPEVELASVDSADVAGNPTLAFLRQEVEVAGSQKKVEKARFAPDLLVGYFNQTLIDVPNPDGSFATASDRFTGFQVGIGIPLWFAPHQGRVKAAEYSRQAAQTTYQYEQVRLSSQFQQALQQYEKSRNSLQYYKTSALPNAAVILRQVQIAVSNGEIGYAEYLLGVRSAVGIRDAYLSTLNDYNQAIIYIEFLSGNK